MTKTVILITEAFPLGGLTEEAFVGPEIAALAAVAERVIVVPLMERGTLAPGLPGNVEVARDIVDAPEWRHRFMRPLCHPLAFLGGLISPAYALAAATVERALRRIVRRHGLTPSTTVAEAFWFDVPTTALARLGIPFVVRAHRYDIYMTRARLLRAAAIRASQGIYAVSDAGARALRERFPAEATKIHTALLGVDIPPTPSRPSESYPRRISFLSVGSVEPRKRVEMGLTMLNALAVARVDTEIIWTHVGGGPGLDALRAAARSARSNMEVRLLGAIPNDALMELYRREPIDWLMHWSASEGLPFAIMEAMAHGVPVIATDVGGVGEIVDDDCGILMPPDPEPEEFVRGLIPFLDSRLRHDSLAAGARRKIAEKFDARTLRADFARKIINLIP